MLHDCSNVLLSQISTLEKHETYIMLSSVDSEFLNSLPTDAFAAKSNKSKIDLFYSEVITVHFTRLQTFH